MTGVRWRDSIAWRTARRSSASSPSVELMKTRSRWSGVRIIRSYCSGCERALESGPVGGRPVRRKQALHRQLEQRAQALGDLLARDVAVEPPLVDRDALSVVGERVARDHGSPALDPEHDVVAGPAGKRLDAEWQPVAGDELVRLTAAFVEQPFEIRA